MSSADRYRSNPQLAVAYTLLVRGQIVSGMGRITKRDPFRVSGFNPELVITERSPEWHVLVLALERLAAVMNQVWGEEAVAVLANWMSRVRYIGLYDWHQANAVGVTGMVFDWDTTAPTVHLAAFDVNEIGLRDRMTGREHLDMMAAVILHELVHVGETLHTELDEAYLSNLYQKHMSKGRGYGLSISALEEGEMIAWVIEMATFGYKSLKREAWEKLFGDLVTWIEMNQDRLFFPFTKQI